MTRQSTWSAGRSALFIAVCLAALLTAGLYLGVWWHKRHRPPILPHLTVTFMDVGNGDCTLLQTPDGKNVLIDTGSEAQGDKMVTALHLHHIRVLDLLVLAGAFDENIGGVPRLLRSDIRVLSVWDNRIAIQSDVHRSAMAAIRLRDVPTRTVHESDQTEIGVNAMRLSVLWPPEHGSRARIDPLVCRLDYGNTAFLLAAPANGEVEQNMVSEIGAKLSCADQYGILEIVGHGADMGTSPELLRLATPGYAIISCGPEQPATAGTMHRLQAAGAETWRTDTLGMITVTTDGRSIPLISAAHEP